MRRLYQLTISTTWHSGSQIRNSKCKIKWLKWTKRNREPYVSCQEKTDSLLSFFAMTVPQIFLSVHSFVSLKVNVSFLFLRSHYQKFESQYVTNTTRHSNEIKRAQARVTCETWLTKRHVQDNTVLDIFFVCFWVSFTAKGQRNQMLSMNERNKVS